MAWIVYKDDSGEVVGGFPDQSAADTYATTVTGWSSADLGADLPAWFFIGCHWDGTSLAEDAPQGSTVEDLKVAAHQAVDQLLGWATGLDGFSPFEPANIVAKGHDWLAWAHFGLNMVCRSTSWTLAKRINFCKGLAMGAADVTSPAQFFAKAGDLDAPTEPVVWSDPRTDNGDRVNLSGAVTLTDALKNDLASQPTVDEIASRSWIAGLAV